MKLPFVPRRRSESISREPPRGAPIAVERAGRGQIDRVLDSARRVPWTLTLLQLLWTAGPVTYLAMQGGFLLGFGRVAPRENFVFFAVFTLLFGLIGVAARVAADATRGERQRAARRHLTRMVDLLPELLFAVRDLSLAQLAPEARRREAATALLHKLDLGPESVALAVEELTGDRSLAEVAERIEIYRRLGMSSRVQDLVAASEEHRAAALEKLHATAPDAVEVLRERLTGIAPTAEQGVARGDNFIERIQAASQDQHLALMRLADAEDLLVLAFELLSDRRITRLSFEYEGDRSLGSALERVETVRNRYRLGRAMAISRLHSLADYLLDAGVTGLDEASLRLPPGELIDRVAGALESLVAELEAPAPVRRWSGAPTPATLEGALRLVTALIQALRESRARRGQYLRALERWAELHRERLHAPGGRGGRLRVRERSLHLDDDGKLELARQFCAQLEELGIRSSPRGLLCRDGPLSPDDAKHIAIRLAMLLDRHVGLSLPGVQRSIYATNAAYFGGLEQGLSVDAKAGLGAAMVKEVEQDLGRAAEALALRLTRVYRVSLTDELVGFLVRHYGAGRERLEVLATTAAEEETEVTARLGAVPSPIPLDSARFRRILQRARRLLA